MLATLFASTGTIMLTAGDEFARSQNGNNNAYAQDNPSCWIGWDSRDRALEDFVAKLARARLRRGALATRFPQPGVWLGPDDGPMSDDAWADPRTDGVTYAASGTEYGPLRISRAGRMVVWDTPS